MFVRLWVTVLVCVCVLIVCSMRVKYMLRYLNGYDHTIKMHLTLILRFFGAALRFCGCCCLLSNKKIFSYTSNVRFSFLYYMIYTDTRTRSHSKKSNIVALKSVFHSFDFDFVWPCVYRVCRVCRVYTMCVVCCSKCSGVLCYWLIACYLQFLCLYTLPVIVINVKFFLWFCLNGSSSWLCGIYVIIRSIKLELFHAHEELFRFELSDARSRTCICVFVFIFTMPLIFHV